nr:pyruvate, water dikinase regulatory protein [Vagococcus proximus]
MSNEITIYIMSDSIGETIQKNINAVLAQFSSVEKKNVRRFSFINSKEELRSILEEAVSEQAIVATTFVSKDLNLFAAEFSKENQLEYVDFMSPLLEMISRQTGVEPEEKPGSIYRMNERYFKQVEAVEFAVRYDDGKEPQGFLKSDIVILGISRTSKTPLSMYLANKSYKVSNLPLIPEVALPDVLHQVPSEKIVGLIAEPVYIQKIRQSRADSMGLTGKNTYVDLARITEEIAYARRVYEQLGATIINIDNKAIEETASLIEALL